MFVDSHCHLNFEAFDSDRDEVLARAREAKVLRILNPGIDLRSSRAVIKIAQAYQEVYAAVGVHPNEALTWNTASLDELRKLAREPKVVAIGEIGLDYYRQRAPHDIQRIVFRQQLELAAECSLPVIIHLRNAGEEDLKTTKDLISILSEWFSRLVVEKSPLVAHPGVLHSFSADLDTARKAVEMGFLIGITGPITFKNAIELQRIVRALPSDHLIVETDAPFLTPHPHRGGRNEPAYVRFVAEKSAQIRNESLQEFAGVITLNSERLFNW